MRIETLFTLLATSIAFLAYDIAWALPIFLLVLYSWVSISLHSLALHICSAHGMVHFSNIFIEKCVYIILFLGMGPSYLDPYTYAVLHQHHHKHADTDIDSHRPYPGFFGPLLTMLATAQRYSAIFHKKESMDVDGKAVRIGYIPIQDRHFHEWRSFTVFVHHPAVRMAWGILYSILYIWMLSTYNLSLWWCILLPGFILMAPLHGLIVNYVAHLWGDQAYDTGDTSRNIPTWIQTVLAFFGFDLSGELYHNSHHFKPTSIDFSLGENPTAISRFARYLERLKILRIQVIPQKI